MITRMLASEGQMDNSAGKRQPSDLRAARFYPGRARVRSLGAAIALLFSHRMLKLVWR